MKSCKGNCFLVINEVFFDDGQSKQMARNSMFSKKIYIHNGNYFSFHDTGGDILMKKYMEMKQVKKMSVKISEIFSK